MKNDKDTPAAPVVAEGLTSTALRKLCDQLDGEKRRMRHTPGTGQNHSYLPCEDIDAYVEEARKALSTPASCEECAGTGKCGPDEDPNEMDCEVCNGSGRFAAHPVAGSPAECGACHGSGWVVRDADIGTEQECFSCGGSGVSDDEREGK